MAGLIKVVKSIFSNYNPISMIQHEELLTMKAVAICFKPFLKPEEAMIYCNLGRTQLAKKCDENQIYKTTAGYYKKEDLDRMMAGSKPNGITIRRV